MYILALEDTGLVSRVNVFTSMQFQGTHCILREILEIRILPSGKFVVYNSYKIYFFSKRKINKGGSYY